MTVTFSGLARFDYSNQPRRNEAAGKRRFFHQQQNVERIAIFAECSGNEPEVEWKYRARWKNFFQFKKAKTPVEIVFITRAFGGFDNDVKFSLRIKSRKIH